MFQSHLLAAICLKLLFSSVIDCYLCAKEESKYDNEDSIFNKYKEELRCYHNTTDYRDNCPINTDFNIKNNTPGKLVVEFKLHNNIKEYVIRLMVGNVSKEEECNANFTTFKLLHSSRIFHTPVCESNGSVQCQNFCNDTGSVSFNFVYTDCYKLSVSPKKAVNAPSDARVCSDITSPVFYKQGFKRPAAEKSNILPSYDKVQKQLTLKSVNDENTWVEATISLFAVNAASTTVWALVLHPTKQIETIYFSNMTNSTNNSIDCSITENDDVTCTLSNIIESTMEICSITLNAPTRCAENTIWTSNKKCFWKFPYTPQGENDPVTGHNDRNYSISAGRVTWISIIVIGFVVIIIIITRWCWNKREIKLPARAQDSDPQLSTKPNQQLLLLYARDCPPFMDLMKSFRQILEDYAQFEVHDCYDESRDWEEKSLNPSGWMLRLVADKRVKIIVVASKCAYLRQQALSAHHDIRYAYPNPNDLLFMPAFQYLNETRTQNDYKKVFVVRFDGFSDDGVLFTHINEYTRFALPKHFHELINCLQESVISNNTLTELDNLKDLQILEQDLTRLIKYVDQNGNYLSSLLFETEIVVGKD